jgi:anti-sigma B factor antagonist
MGSKAGFTSRFEIDENTRICVVSLTGHLDPEAVEDLHPQVQELVRAGFQRYVFDFTKLQHIGSLGLRLLVGLANQVKGSGAVVLCSVPTAMRSIFEITKVDQVLRIYPNRHAAEDAVTSR